VKRAQNLFLTGMMGAGKTTVGRMLARRLKRPFYDSDQEIERRCGVEVMHVNCFMDAVFKNMDPVPAEALYDCQIEKCV